MSNYDKRGTLDSAIDEAVRELMQVDPRPGLRHRVGGSIRSQAARGRGGFGTGFAWAGALVVLVLASLVLLRQTEPSRPAVPPQVVAGPPAAPALPPVGPQAVDSPRQARTRKAPRPQAAPESIFGPRTARVAATAVPLVALPGVSSDTPAEPAAIPGGLPPIAPISVAPLWIPPLTIDPLTLGSLPVRR